MRRCTRYQQLVVVVGWVGQCDIHFVYRFLCFVECFAVEDRASEDGSTWFHFFHPRGEHVHLEYLHQDVLLFSISISKVENHGQKRAHTECLLEAFLILDSNPTIRQSLVHHDMIDIDFRTIRNISGIILEFLPRTIPWQSRNDDIVNTSSIARFRKNRKVSLGCHDEQDGKLIVRNEWLDPMLWDVGNCGVGKKRNADLGIRGSRATLLISGPVCQQRLLLRWELGRQSRHRCSHHPSTQPLVTQPLDSNQIQAGKKQQKAS